MFLSMGVAVFVVAIIFSSNMKALWIDLWSGNIVRYHQSLNHRADSIRFEMDSGVQDISVPRLPETIPQSIFFSDIESDPRNYKNMCYAEYLGIHSIKIE